MLPGEMKPGPFAQGRPADLPPLRYRPPLSSTSAENSDNDDSGSSSSASSSESAADSLLSEQDDEYEEEAAFVPAGSGRRSQQSAVPWTEFATVRGWRAVDDVLHKFAKDCSHMPLISRSGNLSNRGVTYRYECACANTIHCPWQCKVFIPLDQACAADRYSKVGPDAASTGDVSEQQLDRRRYCKQSMFAVKKPDRHVAHANHVCVISVGGVHIAHTAYQRNGAHNMWQAFCVANPFALSYRRHEIQKWLHDNKIETTSVCMQANGKEVRSNKLHVMVDKCKRWAERFLRSCEDGDGIHSNYEGKLLALCQKYSFEATVEKLGIENFTANTPYILPGWSSTAAEDSSAGGFCVLVSTMNLALNHARACAWFAGNVTLAVDHTFKVFFHD